MQSGEGHRLLMSACLVGAGAVHVDLAVAHGAVSTARVAFLIGGGLQLVAALVVRLRHRAGLHLAIFTSLAPFLAWCWTRVASLPFIDDHANRIDAVGAFTGALEVIAIGVAAVSLRSSSPIPSRRTGWTIDRGARAAALVIPLSVAVLLLRSPDQHEHEHGIMPVTHGQSEVDDSRPCPERAGSAPTFDGVGSAGSRFDSEAGEAFEALSARSILLPCGTIAESHHAGHGTAHRVPTGADVVRSPEEARRFTAQWDAAVASVPHLRTEAQARAAGYLKASAEVPGVGAHWIDWTRVDRPFHPAEPSMVLFHAWPDQQARLVGFSYWVRSEGGPPDGFAGPEDQWHRHLGLCFDDGWLIADGVPSPEECAGGWISGHDLWMLHAWVVPEEPSGDGPFSNRNRRICPGDRSPIPDVVKCPRS